MRPSRPATTRAGSTGVRGSGAADVNTEISSARRGSSSGVTGAKRGSSRAAATVISRTTSPSGRSSAMRPTHPRSAPASGMVTKAPRPRAAPGTSGRGGSSRPARCAASVARAKRSSAARSAAVNSGSPMVRLPPADGVGTIQLLVQDDARQLVREREAGEAPDALGLVQHWRRQRCGAAQGERHVPSLQLPAGRPVRQLTRRALLPLFRQRDEARALGNRLEDSRLVLQFPLLHLRIAPQPLEIPVTCRSEEHTSELQSPCNLVCRLLLEKK